MEAKKENSPSPMVVVKKIIKASREQVFDAWTKPELMQQWFVGGKGTAKIDVDLRVGGTYKNEMFIEKDCPSSGQGKSKLSETQSYLHTGKYLEIIRPEKIVFTWKSPSVENSIVTVDLKEVATGTEVTITHTLPTLDLCESHQTGWTYALSGLEAILKIAN